MKKRYLVISIIVIAVILLSIFLITRAQKKESPNNIGQEAVADTRAINEADIDENDSSYIE